MSMCSRRTYEDELSAYIEKSKALRSSAFVGREEVQQTALIVLLHGRVDMDMDMDMDMDADVCTWTWTWTWMCMWHVHVNMSH